MFGLVLANFGGEEGRIGGIVSALEEKRAKGNKLGNSEAGAIWDAIEIGDPSGARSAGSSLNYESGPLWDDEIGREVYDAERR